MSKLSKEGWLDQCSHCKRWVPRVELIRQLTRAERSEGSNYFLYSSYNASGWTCDASDVGTISWTNSGSWIRVNDNVTTTRVGGTQTWQGSGTFETINGTSTVDCSSWTTGKMSFRCGYYHLETSVGATYVVGAKNGANLYQIASGKIRGSGKYGGVLTLSDVAVAHRSALDWYITVTCPTATTRWWIDVLQLEKNETFRDRRQQVVYTTGTAIDRAAQKRTEHVIACSKCRDKYRPDLINQYHWNPERMPDIPEDMEVD